MLFDFYMKKRTSVGVTKFVIGILLSNIIRLFRFIPKHIMANKNFDDSVLKTKIKFFFVQKLR
jgi:hypothetical protein